MKIKKTHICKFRKAAYFLFCFFLHPSAHKGESVMGGKILLLDEGRPQSLSSVRGTCLKEDEENKI